MLRRVGRVLRTPQALGCAALVALAFGFNLLVTRLVQWAIEAAFNYHAPFWALFVLLFVAGSLLRGRSR